MSWCHRITVDFDISSTATAALVLQEALDCFVACIPSPQRRVQVAEAIGAKLNITKVKVSIQRLRSVYKGQDNGCVSPTGGP